MKPRLAALMLLAAVMVVIVGHVNARSFLQPGETTGYNQLFRSFSNPFPEALIDQLLKESLIAEASVQSLKHNKYSTFWYALTEGKEQKPRFACELAVQLLKEIDFPGSTFKELGIVGAEWWFQLRSTKETISFHYDKDEGKASNEYIMEYPQLSTVSYLTNNGGPTLVFNQTSINGNENLPRLPSEGGLFFPSRNKHITFNGNLQHGVVGPLAADIQTDGRRVTFLVNWWTYKPQEPNCVAVPDGSRFEKEIGDFFKKTLPKPSATRNSLTNLYVGDHQVQTLDVYVPPKILYKVQFPISWDLKASKDYYLTWQGNQVLGNIQSLSVENGQFQGLEKYHHRDRLVIFVAGLDRYLLSFLEVIKSLQGDYVYFSADVQGHPDMLRLSQYELKQLPAVSVFKKDGTIKRFPGPLSQSQFRKLFTTKSSAAKRKHDEL